MNIENNSAGVSVIICCYNSAARLPQTLKHMADQLVPEGFDWEIILINNASTDNTVECATEIWRALQTPGIKFRIIDEPRPGQMFARKKGAKEAIYEYILFCDDDNWLHCDYVFSASRMMHKSPVIGAGGGQNLPVTDADQYPEWFEDYKNYYATGIPAHTSGDVTERGFVLGAGLVTRRSLFLKVFDEQYPSLLNGRNGEILSTGDDFEYCKRLLLWDYKLYYEERMKLNHFIPKERLTIAYRQQLMKGIAEAGSILAEYDFALYVKSKFKNKNRFRLLTMAPFRIIFARMGWSKRDFTEEKIKLFYLAPFSIKADQRKLIIKKFINHKQSSN